MFEELHPKEAHQTPSEDKARQDHFNGISALRLASEYEAAFGRGKLELLIRTQNPDSEHLPGQLHKLLLQLPWKDVFTTNYDTLLERTEVSGRAYQPVTSTRDLATTFSPRIVKLHGSFPSQTPFIITEDDYRSYPRLFAAFVNTVQQALIENSLVLVGFSGDDPNFLQWIGWIRDQLGDHHAPIYLVGPLRLSNAQRKLLGRRGVTPIDLTPVFIGKNPQKGMHAASLEWFFNSLLAAKPQRPEQWRENESASAPHEIYEPIIIGKRDEAQPISVGLHPDHDGPLDEQAVTVVISRWNYERRQYPGWLVAPKVMRSDLWAFTEYWIQPIISSIREWDSADRVMVLSELNWRHEVAMVPLFSEIIEPIETSVSDLFPSLLSNVRLSTSDNGRLFLNASHGDIVQAWLELAFGLLRDARNTFASERWTTIMGMIRQVVSAYSSSKDRYHYEEVLWRVCNVDRSAAKIELARWNPSQSSPLASMWKAGLLAELDELDESRLLLRTALRSTRSALRQQGQNIELLSIEGWCTYLLFAIEQALDFKSRSSVRQEFLARWAELKAWDCDPWTLLGQFAEISSSLPPQELNGKTNVQSLDSDECTVVYHWSVDSIVPWLPAFSYLRLFEQVGIPLRLPHLDIGGEALRNSCILIGPFIEYWSPAILVRAGMAKELKNYAFLSRAGVATMQPTVAQRLHKWGIDALTRELESLRGHIQRHSAQESLLTILPELLSRLAFRLDEDSVDQAFRIAMRYHSVPSIRTHSVLSEHFRLWFRQVFEAATDGQLVKWLPDLMRAPYVNGAHFSQGPRFCESSDPMYSFPVDRGRQAVRTCPNLLQDLLAAIDWLLKRAQSEFGVARQRILSRLFVVYGMQLMTAEHKAVLGELLWTGVPENDLPDFPKSLFGLLQLPSPDCVNSVARIRIKLLELVPNKAATLSADGGVSYTHSVEAGQTFADIASCTKPVVQLTDDSTGFIEWTTEESWSLWLKAVDWWQNDKALLAVVGSGLPFDGLVKDTIVGAMRHFDYFLARAVIPKMNSSTDAQFSDLFDFVADAKARGIGLAVCLPYILLHRPAQLATVEAAVRCSLSVGDADEVTASSLAVRHWIHLSSAGLIAEPENSLLDDLINRIIFRRPEGVCSCIWNVTMLLIEKPNSFEWSRIRLLVASLAPWHGAIRLPRGKGDGGDFAEKDRPSLLGLIGMLSEALSEWISLQKPDMQDPPEILFWRDVCDRSPLPNVKRSRHALKCIAVEFAD